jgi:hypothetical protein
MLMARIEVNITHADRVLGHPTQRLSKLRGDRAGTA